ncbi:Fic family protein [Castellaniella hirudinis]|uniref:Fic family protein n=1 Tax=Castellaniella hirudinis TaxID=1144617 RepID=UPI0039C2C0A0
MAKFVHHELRLLNPSFDSPLVDTLEELSYLRRHRVGGSTPAPIFFQLKDIFHILESLGSARIEGNHTTLADYVDHKLSPEKRGGIDHLKEIENIESAMDFIEDTIGPREQVTEHFVRELHSLTVGGLPVHQEGDRTPGAYRKGAVSIAQSKHLPPESVLVPSYMGELISFINKDDPQKYDLMKVALAHHRFGWIHPFSNGNGRVVRLLTYALMMKYGFNVKAGGRLLNPTAVFCNDRDKYYEMLGVADQGTDESLEQWCTYVLAGVLTELQKVDRLTNYTYLIDSIFKPAIRYALDREHITTEEARILAVVLTSETGQVKSGDLAEALPDLTAPQRTRRIAKLVESRMLVPITERSRIYHAGLSSSYLIRGIIHSLADEGFISARLAGGAVKRPERV